MCNSSLASAEPAARYRRGGRGQGGRGEGGKGVVCTEQRRVRAIAKAKWRSETPFVAAWLARLGASSGIEDIA